jgi:hypothetical protein
VKITNFIMQFEQPFKRESSTKVSSNGVHEFSNTFFAISDISLVLMGSRDSSVGITLGYGLDDRDSRVRFPAGAGNSSLHHRVQNGSGAHPASYSMGTRFSFPGVKRLGREADHSPPSSAEVKE